MILNTITLHNFMSYGDASLDLSSCLVACLSGSNGAGKSAILDAITWALWECARSTSDELIRASEQEMWVDLTFELEGNLYRVRRSRQRTFPRGGVRATSKGTLDFQMRAGEHAIGSSNGSPAGNGNGASDDCCHQDEAAEAPAGWQSLTAANVRDTQARICQVLRMDYDTFINSVYLKQGRADEFTTRPPAERKQVLSEILGLSYFDRLQELAKERARERKARLEVLQASLGDAESIGAELAARRASWHAATNQLEQERLQRGTTAARLNDLHKEITEIGALELQLEPTQNRLAEIGQDIDAIDETHRKLSARRDQITELLSSIEDAASVTARFKELREQVEKLDQISLERQELDTRRLELKSLLATTRGRMEVELEHLQSQHEALLAQRRKLEAQIAGREKLTVEFEQYRNLLHAEAEMAQRQEAFAQLTMRAEQLHTAVIENRFHLEAQLEQKQHALSELTALMQSRESLDHESEQLEGEQQMLDTAEVEFEHVEQQGIKLKQDIDGIDLEIGQLKKQQVENGHKSKELHDAKSLSMCPLCAAPIVDRSAVLARYTSIHEQLDAQVDELENKKVQCDQKRNELRHRYAELKRKRDGRKSLDRRIGEFNARQAALTRADENHQRLTAEVEQLRNKLETQSYAEIERESLISIKGELHKLEFDPIIYSSLQAQIRSLRHIDIRFQQIKRDEADLTQLMKDLPALEAKIDKLKSTLGDNNYGPDERTQVKALEEELKKYPYDRTAHQSLKQELAKLLPLVDRLKDIDRALDEQPEICEQIASYAEKLESRRTQKVQLVQSIATWTARLAKLPAVRADHAQAQEQLQTIEESLQNFEREAVVLHTQVQQLEQQLVAFELKQQQVTALITEINDFTLLAEAFGKKGIQAVIIENAVPEIEAEANRILSRLTDNQMHVALITQQRTKQGHLVETLEIVIADQLGTRAYELYSGGEAFKINFAIRLALSRLLARRAGAKLQTLIIDEGFGSQDEASRGRLVGAINAIRNDFARILIVTHIAEIKDLFPVQIQVQKDNGRSSINLVHAF